MATHCSTLAWKIPWMEAPGGLQSMGSLGVGHNWETSLSRIGEGNGNPLQCSCLENPRDGRAWWAAVYGVAQSRTWLKRLSSSSSSCFLFHPFYYVTCPLGRRGKQRVDFVKSQKATLQWDLWKTFWVILCKEWVSMTAAAIAIIINGRGAWCQRPLPSEKPHFHSAVFCSSPSL